MRSHFFLSSRSHSAPILRHKTSSFECNQKTHGFCVFFRAQHSPAMPPKASTIKHVPSARPSFCNHTIRTACRMSSGACNTNQVGTQDRAFQYHMWVREWPLPHWTCSNCSQNTLAKSLAMIYDVMHTNLPSDRKIRLVCRCAGRHRTTSLPPTTCESRRRTRKPLSVFFVYMKAHALFEDLHSSRAANA